MAVAKVWVCGFGGIVCDRLDACKVVEWTMSDKLVSQSYRTVLLSYRPFTASYRRSTARLPPASAPLPLATAGCRRLTPVYRRLLPVYRQPSPSIWTLSIFVVQFHWLGLASSINLWIYILNKLIENPETFRMFFMNLCI